MAKIKWKNKTDIDREQKEQEPLQKQRETMMDVIKVLAQGLKDEYVHVAKDFYDEWQGDKDYVVGEVIRHDDLLYKIKQAHKSQEQYPPSIDTASLYLMIPNPEDKEKILPWEDRWSMGKELYSKGERVTHNGFTWESTIDRNHYEPTEANWAAWEKGEVFNEVTE